jgi:Cu+-exporting ATPase
VGALIRIRPGDKISVDGIVIKGSSAINESMMTGEAMPSEKDVDSFVIAGTLNGTGSFIMKATKVGADTLLSQVHSCVAF